MKESVWQIPRDSWNCAGIFTAGGFCLGVCGSRVNRRVMFCYFQDQADSAFADSFTFLL